MSTGLEWKVEVVVVPVADVDRAKAFYTETLGFHLDVDHRAGDEFRIVQMTPPGSACSLTIGVGIGTMAPGSLQGVHLVVRDVEAVHELLTKAGVVVEDVHHFADGQRAPGPDPTRADYNSFLSFRDPDGNQFVVQEVGHARERVLRY